MAGTVTQLLEMFGPARNLATLTFTCTADADDASYPSTAISTAYWNLIKGWELGKIQTIPDGVTAPDDDTDFTLKDSNGVDVLGGAGANKIMNATNKEFYPDVDGGPATQELNSILTLAISNNATNSAITTIKLFLKKII